MDYFLPGCPPSADAIWTFLTELLSGAPIAFPYTQPSTTTEGAPANLPRHRIATETLT